MKKYLLFKSPAACFFTGLILNFTILLLLEIIPITHFNLQYPEEQFKNNIWGASSDIEGYFEPARNFVYYGIFGDGSYPDAHRTMGYQMLIALFFKIFASNWHFALLIFQSIIFAFIYPLVFKTVKLLFDDNESLASLTVSGCIILGSYLCYVHFIYTDTLFALLFIAGLFFGLRSVINHRISDAALHVIIIGYASQVRPVLSLYAVTFILMGYAFAKKNNTLKLPLTKTIIAVSAGLLLILSNGPSIRNYINYHSFMSTDVMSNNLFRYIAGKIAIDKNLKEEYAAAKADVLAAPDDIVKSVIERKYALQFMKAHPFSTLKWIAAYGIWNSFETHWTALFNYFDLNWYKHKFKYQISYANIVIGIIFAAVQLVIYSLFIIFIYRRIKNGEWAFVAGIFFMLLPLLVSYTGGGGARQRISVEWFILAGALSIILDTLPKKNTGPTISK